MALLELTATPDSYQFAAHEESELRRMLAEIDRSTTVIPIGSTSEIMLDPLTGRTKHGYIYTDAAFVQICSLTAPGLAQFVPDISGQFRRPGEDKRFFSGELAIETLNRAFRIRFERKLQGWSLVRNSRTKTIDGLVGVKYRYLANSNFFDQSAEALGDAKFYGAYLYGRQLVARFIMPSEHGCTIADERYSLGYHFANSEIGGRSVRAAFMLIRNATGHSALGNFAGGTGSRVVHSGRDFEKRLTKLFGGISLKLPDTRDIAAKAERLINYPLNLGGPDRQKRIKQLATALVRRKLSQQMAKRVLSRAAMYGRGAEENLLDVLPEDHQYALESRTAYDLFAALIAEAAKLPIDQREAAEQTAYALLTGKFTL